MIYLHLGDLFVRMSFYIAREVKTAHINLSDKETMEILSNIILVPWALRHKSKVQKIQTVHKLAGYEKWRRKYVWKMSE